MRIITILIYMISLIPHFGIASSLCQSDLSNSAFESTELSHNCSSSDIQSCNFETDHHVHTFCTDSSGDSLRPSNETEISFEVTEVKSPFEALFRALSLRAPPVQYIYATHTLPALYGHTLVKTTQFLC